MEPFKIIVGVGALLAFILPIMYLRWLEHVKNKSIIDRFQTIAKHSGLNITKFDYWNICYCIGKDDQNKKLLYVKIKDGVEIVNVIDLNRVSKCTPINENRQVKTHNGNSSAVDFLGINIKYTGSSETDKILEFYNSKESISLSGEVGLMNKWVEMINLKSEKK